MNSNPTGLYKKLRRKKHLSTQRELYDKQTNDFLVSFPSSGKMKTGKKESFFQINEDLDIKKTEDSILDGKTFREKRTKSGKDVFSSLRVLNTGFSAVSPIISCLILGLLLDNIYGTKPTFIFIFVLIGSISSLYNLLKIIKDNRL